MASAATLLDTQQFIASYASGIDEGQVVNLQLTAGGQATTAAYTFGLGRPRLPEPQPGGAAEPGDDRRVVLQGGLGLALAIILVLVATSLAAYAIFLLVTRDSHLNSVLQPYSEGYGPSQDELDEADDGSYAKTAIIQRAVAATETFAESQGYLGRAETALERANPLLRAG